MGEGQNGGRGQEGLMKKTHRLKTFTVRKSRICDSNGWGPSGASLQKARKHCIKTARSWPQPRMRRQVEILRCFGLLREASIYVGFLFHGPRSQFHCLFHHALGFSQFNRDKAYDKAMPRNESTTLRQRLCS